MLDGAKKLVRRENRNDAVSLADSQANIGNDPPKETIKQPVPEYINLFEMDNDQADEFRERVAAWGGLIRIFVHPRFTKYAGPSLDNPHYPGRDERVFKGLMRLVGLPANRTPPILLFEQEGDDLRETKKAIDLPLGNGKNQNVYIVETEWHDPEPVGFSDGFAALKDQLERLDVKRVIVAGIYMWIEHDSNIWSPDRVQKADHPLFRQRQFLLGENAPCKKYSYSGCAGHTLVKLAEYGFEVAVSGFASPRNHRDATLARENQNLPPVETIIRTDDF